MHASDLVGAGHRMSEQSRCRSPLIGAGGTRWTARGRMATDGKCGENEDNGDDDDENDDNENEHARRRVDAGEAGQPDQCWRVTTCRKGRRRPQETAAFHTATAPVNLSTSTETSWLARTVRPVSHLGCGVLFPAFRLCSTRVRHPCFRVLFWRQRKPLHQLLARQPNVEESSPRVG